MRKSLLLAAVLALGLGSSTFAATIPLTFVKLTGTTGGSPAETAVYRATIAANTLSSILSISITDNSSRSAGAAGKFSGFDLDAVKLSTTSVTSASSAKSLAGLNVFNFGSGTLFTPGAQVAPVAAKLFGTGPTGNTVNNSVATLGAFDANSTTGVDANGFLSLGFGGKIAFNLTSPVSNSNPLYLYIGEVGDNGEVVAGSITVSDKVAVAPVPSAALVGLLTMGVVVASGLRRRKA